MRMDLIQPFIGSLDAVLAEMMKEPPKIADLTMEEEGYRRKGLAAEVMFKGQIEGRIVLDMDPSAATRVAEFLSGGEVDPSEPIVPEVVCELANMVIGNAVTQLNDRGFQFKVLPPTVLDGCAVRECRAGFGGDDSLLRNSQRQSAFEHRDEVPHAPRRRANAGGRRLVCGGLTVASGGSHRANRWACGSAHRANYRRHRAKAAEKHRKLMRAGTDFAVFRAVTK